MGIVNPDDYEPLLEEIAELLRTSIRWLTIAAIVLVGVEFVIVPLNVPAVVGVPEITPVELSSESPGGRLPENIDQV